MVIDAFIEMTNHLREADSDTLQKISQNCRPISEQKQIQLNLDMTTHIHSLPRTHTRDNTWKIMDMSHFAIQTLPDQAFVIQLLCMSFD